MSRDLARRVLIVAVTVMLSGGAAIAGDDLFVESPGRLMPVAPETPIPEDVEREFDQSFRKEVIAALASADLADDAALAFTLYCKARDLSDRPQLAARLQDYVVYVGSGCPNGQDDAYRALRDQATSGSRPVEPCLEKMMIIGERQADSEAPEYRGGWISHTWLPDAVSLWQRRIQAGRFREAGQTMRRLQACCVRHKLDVPEAVTERLQATDVLVDFDDARRRASATVAQGGDHSQERALLAVAALAIDDDAATALAQLKQCRLTSAADLAYKLGRALDAPDSGPQQIELALALATFAKDVDSTFAKLLLCRRAVDTVVGALSGIQLSEDDALRAQRLRESLEYARSQAAAKVPQPVHWIFNVERLAAAGQSSFFGVSGAGSKIVFLVEGGGSLTDSIIYVKHELVRSIAAMKPGQQFSVIFFPIGPSKVLPPGRLVPATEANKQAAADFLYPFIPTGQADPSGALVAAFKLEPDLIYLLTDGEFDRDNIGLIDRLNANRRVTINTICFIYTGGEKLLQEVARQNKGRYKYVGEDDLPSLK